MSILHLVFVFALALPQFPCVKCKCKRKGKRKEIKIFPFLVLALVLVFAVSLWCIASVFAYACTRIAHVNQPYRTPMYSFWSCLSDKLDAVLECR